MRKAINSFKKGSAGGPDGLLPQHLIDMTGEVYGEDSEKLLDSLVTFMNTIVYPGKIPEGVCPSFFGANLMCLMKPDGGIRPIAMGMTLRRLSAKCVMFDLNDFCAKEFQPSQVGVGTPKGAEAAVHALRSYLYEDSNENKVLVMSCSDYGKNYDYSKHLSKVEMHFFFLHFANTFTSTLQNSLRVLISIRDQLER